MPPKRMTANPVKPARYRPGKPIAAEISSSEESDDEVEDQTETKLTASAPKATSFPAGSNNIANNLQKVDLNERRRQLAARAAEQQAETEAERLKEEEGFATEDSEQDGGEATESKSDSDSEPSGSESEESSSEEEAPRVLLRPTFIKKDKRKEAAAQQDGIKDKQELWKEEEARRKAKADAIVQEQLEKNALAHAAGKKAWDDDEVGEMDQVDDTDGVDPEAEKAAWKLRELRRVKRDREVIEASEKEREEVERRRNLSKEEREAEDREFLEKQKEEREDKGKMGFMQKYHHKGAFFQDDSKEQGLDRRDIMGGRFQDDVKDRSILPEFMQIRDMTKLGKKGRTKYKDLKSEDTGRWGTFDSRGSRAAAGGVDERFMPDRPEGRAGATGANASEIRERPKLVQGVTQGPKSSRSDGRSDQNQGNHYRPDGSDDERDEAYYGASRRSPRTRSPRYSSSPQRDRRVDDHNRRKRGRSPYYDRYEGDKRPKIDAR